MFYLCELFGKLPSDPFFEQIDPVEKLWMMYSWLEKYHQDAELLKDQAILIGAFTNPEMARKMAKKVPDAIMTDDEMDDVMRDITSQELSDELKALNGMKVKGKKKKRRVLTDNNG